jgi:hypothetical protein
MKASELIKQLQEHIVEYGDLDCYKFADGRPSTLDEIGYTELEDVYNVEISELDRYDREIYRNAQEVVKKVFKIA